MLFYLISGDEGKTQDTGFPPAGTNDPITFASESVAKSFKDSMNYKNIQGFFVALENEAVKTAKSISNGIVANQQLIADTMFDLFKENLKYGASWKDIQDYITDFGSALGRIPNIQEEVITKAVLFSKATGMATKEVAQYVAGMANIGIGQTKSIEKLNKIYLTGRRFGVDGAKLTKEVATNISKASIYGFKDGVDGLTKMAARAQQLGIKMEQAMKFAQDVLDPDTAIETAASFQMLGGAVGALGDPFQLLYMAQNDVGALQEEMVKATESAVDFNATTGEFKIPVSEMYRLKEMAGKLGMSYEDISENAIKAAKQTQVLSMIELPSSFSEEDKNLVASLSEIQDGDVMIRIPGSDKMTKAADITAAELEKLRDKAEIEGKSAAEIQAEMTRIATEQLSAQDRANISLDQIKYSLVFAKGKEGFDVYPETLKKEAEAASNFAGIVQNLQATKDVLAKLDGIVTDVSNTFTTWANDVNKSGIDAALALNKFKDALENAFPAGSISSGNTSPISTGATVTPPPVLNDVFMGKGGSNKFVQGGFGEFYKLNFNDELLAMPNVSKLLEDANTAFSSINTLEGKLATEMMGQGNMSEKFINFAKNLNNNQTQRKETPSIQDLIGGNLNRLGDVGSTIINQNITSSQKVEGNVGVDGNVNINVNVPNGLLSTALSSDREFQGALKDEIMKVVNYRLSEAYKKGQGNLS